MRPLTPAFAAAITEACATHRRAAHRRRSAERPRPHRAPVLLQRARPEAASHLGRQGARRRRADRRGARQRAGRGDDLVRRSRQHLRRQSARVPRGAVRAGRADRRRTARRTSARVGRHMEQRLHAIAAGHPIVKEVRGAGLIWGLELTREAAPVVPAALARGVVVNRTAETVVRLLPPLVITDAEIDEGAGGGWTRRSAPSRRRTPTGRTADHTVSRLAYDHRNHQQRRHRRRSASAPPGSAPASSARPGSRRRSTSRCIVSDTPGDGGGRVHDQPRAGRAGPRVARSPRRDRTAWRARSSSTAAAPTPAPATRACASRATMAAETARLVGCPADEVLVASTGVIGVSLPIREDHERRCRAAIAALGADQGAAAARAIMTTDPFPKEAAVRVVARAAARPSSAAWPRARA